MSAGPEAPHSRRSVILDAVVLFAASAALRLAFVWEVLREFARLSPENQAELTVGYLTPDSHEYIRLAGLLLEGRFAESISPVRPVVYPAFLALLQVHPGVTLVVQALLMALIPVCTMLLIRLLIGGRVVALIAGFVSCVSPTGIGLAGLVMADALFSPLFAVLFVALLWGAQRQSIRWIILSAVLSALANLSKPILILWPILAVVVYFLAAPRPMIWREHWRPAVILCVVPLAASLTFATANRLQNGLFTVSTIGSGAARIYLAAEVEEWGLAGHRPTAEAITRRQSELRTRLSAMPEPQKSEAYVSESLAIFRRFPLLTLQSLYDDAADNCRAGWSSFPQQIPEIHSTALERTERLIRARTLAVVFLSPLLVLAILRLGRRRDEAGLVRILAAMSLTIAYFAAASGTTFWVGSRVVYPTELLSLACLAVVAHLFVHAVTSRFRKGTATDRDSTTAGR